MITGLSGSMEGSASMKKDHAVAGTGLTCLGNRNFSSLEMDFQRRSCEGEFRGVVVPQLGA